MNSEKLSKLSKTLKISKSSVKSLELILFLSFLAYNINSNEYRQGKKWMDEFVYCTSQTKYVSNEHGVSFHLSPFPSRFQSSRQFSSSPFSYRKLFGSPAFQFVNVIGRPLAIQKKFPSSAKSVPDVQKCSLPRPEKLT